MVDMQPVTRHVHNDAESIVCCRWPLDIRVELVQQDREKALLPYIQNGWLCGL